MIIETQQEIWTRSSWQNHVGQLLSELGSSLLSPSAYDTAWVVRLMDQDTELGDAALQWLCDHQLSDGSWGTEEPACYHDRVICTLSAMTALARYGRRSADRKLIQRGQAALEELTYRATHRLMANPAGATVGFEMLAPTLVKEAETLGLLSDQGGHIMGKLEQQRKLKLAKLGDRRIDRTLTSAFSAEMVGPDLARLDIDNLPEANGSVGYSPSATAFYLSKVRPGDPKALAFLKSVENNGAVPYIGQVDIFEIAWSLWNLALAPWCADLTGACQPHLDRLQRAWSPGQGCGAATGLTLIEGDSTAITFETLSHWGRRMDTESLLCYEAQEHFRCFKFEADPSTSTNIHLLGAFRAAGYSPAHPAVQKIMRFLLSQRMNNGTWVDKWHLSPYYPTAHAVIACTGYADELVAGSIKQLLAWQRPDGAWGATLSTAEETSYALQALCIWKRSGHAVDEAVLRAGARWLVQHVDQPYPPLWIGKSLYCIIRVVQATILSALGMVLQEVGGEL